MLIRKLKDRIGGYTLVFDAFSVYTARKVRNHPSLKTTGAVIQWGIDDPGELVYESQDKNTGGAKT